MGTFTLDGRTLRSASWGSLEPARDPGAPVRPLTQGHRGATPPCHRANATEARRAYSLVHVVVSYTVSLPQRLPVVSVPSQQSTLTCGSRSSVRVSKVPAMSKNAS